MRFFFFLDVFIKIYTANPREYDTGFALGVGNPSPGIFWYFNRACKWSPPLEKRTVRRIFNTVRLTFLIILTDLHKY